MQTPAILTLCFLFTAAAVAALEIIESICKSTVYRKARTVKQPVDKEHYQEIDVPKSPYVHNGMVNILFQPRLTCRMS